MLVVNLTKTTRHGPSPLRHPARAVLLLLFAAWGSFVCSVQEFCLQRAGVLFAACNSFACSVQIFFTVSFLFAACGSFVCSV